MKTDVIEFVDFLLLKLYVPEVWALIPIVQILLNNFAVKMALL